MQAKQILKITAMTQNSGGIGDVIRYRFQPYVLTGAAVTAANNLLSSLTAWRNNIHTELNDGITEIAPTIVAATANDGEKLRYIAREVITAIEGNAMFGVGLVTDATKGYTTPPVPGTREVSYADLGIYGDLVDGETTLFANMAARSADLALRADVIAKAYALWDAVDTL